MGIDRIHIRSIQIMAISLLFALVIFDGDYIRAIQAVYYLISSFGTLNTILR